MEADDDDDDDGAVAVVATLLLLLLLLLSSIDTSHGTTRSVSPKNVSAPGTAAEAEVAVVVVAPG